MMVKQIIESQIRVEEALTTRRSSIQVNRGGISDESPSKIHSLIRPQEVEKKGPLREPPNKPERLYTPCKSQLHRDLHGLKGSKLAPVSSSLKA
jgi:hypothetical protein